MPKFLITYHGGEGVPSTPEAQQQVHAAFGAWMAEVGNAMADPGAPLGPFKSVSADGVDGAPAAGKLGGYTLLEAGTLDEAVGLVESHPFIKRGGTLQVSEAIELG
jgi:hypothetical protein